MLTLISLIASLHFVNSQLSYGQVLLMNTLNFVPSGNFSIGYLPSAVLGQACRRVQMFKFPALTSGNAISISMNVLPAGTPEICDIGFNLYSVNSGQQIGDTFIGAFASGGGSGGANPAGSTLNITSAGWKMAMGNLYYVTIQTFTYNKAGNPCNMRLPYGLYRLAPSQYGLVTQQGPDGQPCGSTPWTTLNTLDGGFIHMRISGITIPSPSNQAIGDSNTPTASPTSMGISDSATSMPTSTGISDSATATPTSMGVSDSETATPTSIGISDSATSTPTSSPTSQEIKTPTSTTTSMGPSYSETSRPSNGPLAAAAVATPEAATIGGVIGAVVLVGLLGTAIAFNLSRSVQANLSKFTGIKDMRSPMTRQNVITVNPVNDTTAFQTHPQKTSV